MTASMPMQHNRERDKTHHPMVEEVLHKQQGAAPKRSKTEHLLSQMIPCVHEQEHYDCLRYIMEIIFQHYNQQRDQSVHFTIGQGRSKHNHTSSGVKHVVFISVLSAFHCFTHSKSQIISRLVCKLVKCTKNSNMRWRMQQMASRKSEALWTASQRKMRHDEPWQKQRQKNQDVEVNIISCKGISFLIPFSSNKTNTKDDTEKV